MASVRLTETIRDKILDAFSIQCLTAFKNKKGLGEYISEFYTKIHSPDFFELLDKWKAYDIALENFAISKKLPKRWHNSNEFKDMHIPPSPFYSSKKIIFLLNKDRPLTDNFTVLLEWKQQHTDKDGNSVDAINFLEKDEIISIQLSNIPNFLSIKDSEADKGLPFLRCSKNNTSYWNILPADRRKFLHLQNAYIVSNPDDYIKIKELAEGEVKTQEAVKKMASYLESITTLKQFLDAWPSGYSLVPADILARQNKPASKPKPKSTLVPADVIPDELKDTIQTAIFENKLLGL